MEKIWPVLMVDDEPFELCDLEDCFDIMSSAISSKKEKVGLESLNYRLRETEVNPYDAIEVMKEYAGRGHKFSAIISDLHMKSEETPLNGDDFLRIIRGNPFYCSSRDKEDRELNVLDFEFSDLEEMIRYSSRFDEDILDFLEYEFDSFSDYKNFVSYFHKNKPEMILLCGNPRELDLTSLEDVPTIQKPYKKESGLCEVKVLNSLKEKSVFPPKLIDYALNIQERIRKKKPWRYKK